MGHGQRERRDQVAGAGADHGGPEHAIAALLQQDPQEPLLLAVEQGAVILLEGHVDHVESDSLLLRFPPVQAGVGHLRRGVGAAGYDQPVGTGAGKEERVLDHDRGMGVGQVGEVGRGRHVAGGEDAGVRRAQLRVDPDAGGVAADADFPESQPFDVGRPAHGHQDFVADGLPLLALAVDPGEPDGAGLGRRFLDPRAKGQLDAVAAKRPFDHGRRVRILARQDAGQHVEDRHPAAEPGEGLRELAADRAGADDGQPPGPLGQGEDGLVGQVAAALEARYRRRLGAGAGGDHGPPEAQLAVAGGTGHGDRAIGEEASFAQVDVDAGIPEALGAVVPADLRADAAHALHRRGEVAGPLGARRAEAGVGAAGTPPTGRGDHALGRHAAEVQAIAAHQPAFDQRHPGAQARGGDRGHQAGRAGADHHQVVTPRRLRVRPVGGRDLVDQRPVVPVLRQQFRPGHSPTSSLSARRAMRVTTAITAIVATSPTPVKTWVSQPRSWPPPAAISATSPATLP